MARILIVDDEPDVRAAMTASLEDAGHTVIQATDGTEVLEIAVGQRPEVIFLDLSMPRVDGFQALHMLKADPRARGIPVVIVSAKGRPEDRIRTRTMGAMDYINKPWGDGELIMRANLALAAVARKSQNPTAAQQAGASARPAQAARPAGYLAPANAGPAQARRPMPARPLAPVAQKTVGRGPTQYQQRPGPAAAVVGRQATPGNGAVAGLEEG
ncbi:MAG: response regulator, partial [Chloroflexi bacterium]|nr:response regulator [Chloroflexota bacterium]